MVRLVHQVVGDLLSNQEMTLAQEQSVLARRGLGSELQGTLVLTNVRLLFVAANLEDTSGTVLTGFSPLPTGLGTVRYYADVEDLESVSSKSPNFSVLLKDIVSVKGSKGVMTNPNLKVSYRSDSSEKSEEFIQTIIGGRKKNLNDWAVVIENLKNGKINIRIPTWLPDKDTLEGRIVEALTDLQQKGVFEIEREIEEKYKVDLDPDEVEEKCNNLVSKEIVERTSDGFYRLPSPLGSDDLSS